MICCCHFLSFEYYLVLLFGISLLGLLWASQIYSLVFNINLWKFSVSVVSSISSVLFLCHLMIFSYMCYTFVIIPHLVYSTIFFILCISILEVSTDIFWSEAIHSLATFSVVFSFIFLDSKITADGDCSHENKRCLLLGRKPMTKIHSILKSRDTTLSTKVCLDKAMVFLVVMYGCESWTIKNVEHLRINAFELWCWRRLLRVPWTSRRSNQSIPKEISPEYSLERLMLKLKLQYFGHLLEELTP